MKEEAGRHTRRERVRTTRHARRDRGARPPEEVTARIADQLAEDLRKAYGTSRLAHRARRRPARGPTGPVDRAARGRAPPLLERGWHLAVVVTDLPLATTAAARSRGTRAGRTASRSSRCRRSGLLHLQQRLRQAPRALRPARRAQRRRAARCASSPPSADDHVSGPCTAPRCCSATSAYCWGWCARTGRGGSRRELYAALIAALAVGAYGVVTSDIWRISSRARLVAARRPLPVSITVTIAR